MNLPKTISLLLVALAAACGPLVQIGGNTDTGDALFTLRADAGAPESAQRGPLTVNTPTVPGSLQTLRIPVVTRDTEVVYLKNANWLEQPQKLFQRLLADTASARGFAVIDARTVAAPGRQLSGQLLEFGLDVRDPAARQVRVRYDATLLGVDGKIAGTRRFETTRPVATEVPNDVAIALNEAANAVAGDVVGWVAGS